MFVLSLKHTATASELLDLGLSHLEVLHDLHLLLVGHECKLSVVDLRVVFVEYASAVCKVSEKSFKPAINLL
jgi:hypothetical protein